MKRVKRWALVTGGSSGIGFEFSRQLSNRGYNLVIVSRDGDRLAASAAKLRDESGILVETISADLSNSSDVEKIIKRLESQEQPIEVLVNDAGFAVHDSLLSEDRSRQSAAFAVMAKAVLELSGAAARAMKQRGCGKIINVSSTSAWLFAGNYSAIKRWVLSYTESLALELKGTNVSVTAVCPGWVKTDFHKNAGVNRPNVPNWIWIPVETVVRVALSAADRGKTRVIPTFRWKVAIFILRHCECIAKLISRKLVTKRIAELSQKPRQ